MSEPRERAPWLLVSGGFHRQGAMDFANLALAEHLLSDGREVYLVGHDIDPVLASRRGVQAHRVPRLGTVVAGELMLGRTARHVSATARRGSRNLHVLANGGNFASADANWVHCVHHAWPSPSGAAPARHRLKRSVEARVFRRREARAFRAARLLVANSERTRQDVLDHFRIDPSQVHVVPPGADPSWRPPSAEERRDARLQFGITGVSVLFVGALGADDNKNISSLLEAWARLCADPTWEGTLMIAGAGALSAHWRRVARESRLEQRVRFLGFVPQMARAFAAADVLVSASRYESYGLAIAEALCRGVPAIVPQTAGIAASLRGAYEPLLIQGAPDAHELAAALKRWSADQPRWRAVACEEGFRRRQYTSGDMAAAIVRVVET